MTITLNVHICDQRRSYTARFATEDQAVAFIIKRQDAKGPNGYSNHVITEDPDHPIDFDALDGREHLYNILYPTCEHGMSLDLCSGPNHYPTYDEERRAAGY